MSGRKEKPSYLLEMVLHPYNGYAALLAILSGALVSIPYGVGLGLLPLIGFAAAEAIAALFIPSHPGFREAVDKKYRALGREQVREHLVQEIEARVGDEASPTWATYHRMRERIASLEAMAQKSETQLSGRDVEALDDATVKYLGYWLAKLTMSDRQAMIDERSLSERLSHVDAELKVAEARSERARLQKTRDDLVQLLKRKNTLRTRQTEVETAMLTMADALEEVFQQVVANPTAPEVGTQLREAAERMRAEEALDHAIDDELGEMLSGPAPAGRKGRESRAQAAARGA